MTSSIDAAFNVAEALTSLRSMLRIRKFEERVHALRAEGQIVGSVHLCIGQEAIPVGACEALETRDAVFATYRGHGWVLARGTPLEATFAELMGREAGLNRGRAGSAYLSAADWGFYGENSIVGAGAPIAVGAALAAKYDGSGRVALVSFGDGAMNQGAVHEAMNFASAFDLGVIFLCENNTYSELTPIGEMVKNDQLYQRATAYSMPGERVDGNDAQRVQDVVRRAANRARAGEGPSLIEAMTQRLVGHYIGDLEQYRPRGEIEAARAVEPIVRLRARLTAAGVASSDLDQLEQDAVQEVKLASERASTSALASVDTVMEHLYA